MKNGIMQISIFECIEYLSEKDSNVLYYKTITPATTKELEKGDDDEMENVILRSWTMRDDDSTMDLLLWEKWNGNAQNYSKTMTSSGVREMGGLKGTNCSCLTVPASNKEEEEEVEGRAGVPGFTEVESVFGRKEEEGKDEDEGREEGRGTLMGWSTKPMSSRECPILRMGREVMRKEAMEDLDLICTTLAHTRWHRQFRSFFLQIRLTQKNRDIN